MAEGGGLLNRYTVKSCIQGSNPCLTATSVVLSVELSLSLSSSARVQKLSKVVYASRACAVPFGCTAAAHAVLERVFQAGPPTSTIDCSIVVRTSGDSEAFVDFFLEAHRHDGDQRRPERSTIRRTCSRRTLRDPDQRRSRNSHAQSPAGAARATGAHGKRGITPYRPVVPDRGKG